MNPVHIPDRAWPRKPSPCFVEDVPVFFAAGHNTIEANGIAANQLHALRERYSDKLKLTDATGLFLQNEGLRVSDEYPRLLDTKRTIVSPWLEVIAREVQFRPDSDVETYYAIAQPDYVIAVAVTPEEQILLVRQYRPAIQRFSLELPAGMLDENEDPKDAIVRELQEETGYVTRSITQIGRAATNASRIDNATYSFFIRTGERVPDFVEEPGVAVSSASPSELRNLIFSGELSEQTHLGALALAQWAGLITL